jgi:hypothetical protein
MGLLLQRLLLLLLMRAADHVRADGAASSTSSSFPTFDFEAAASDGLTFLWSNLLA